MKKFFIFLAVLVGVVVVAVLVIGAIEPTDINVTRSVVIKAPKEAVFEQMVLFKNWTHWSPWYKMDSTMKMTYTGTDGQPGSGYSWVGSEKTGAGSMTNKGVSGTELSFQVDFTEPRKGTAQGKLTATDTAGNTKATWTFSMHMPYPLNAMSIFMDMDKMLGGDFENGLGNMKKYVEANAKPAVEITEVDYPARIFQGVHQMVFWNEMSKFFMDSYGMLGKEIGPKISGPAVGVFYTWDTVNKRADMVAAFPVSDSTKAVKGASFVNIDASKAVMAVQKGGYSKAMEIHMALGKYCAAKGKTPSLVIEEYAVGPHEEADSNKWVTNIYYLVK